MARQWLSLIAIFNVLWALKVSLKLHVGRAETDAKFLQAPQRRSFVIPEIVKRSLHTRSDASMSTALCYKTMYGNIDMDRVLRWVAYHHLLGFDHIFLWYLSPVAQFPGFAQLKALPYVTLLENTKGNMTVVPEKSRPNHPYYRVTGEGGDQAAVEHECLNNFAKGYDWVMNADVDEYLWFNETMGLHDFIRLQTENSPEQHYLSFGKRQYAISHQLERQPTTATPDSGFGLDSAPFRAGYYCFGYLERKRGREVCPGWKGSSKVLVRPQRHHRVNVHGTLMGFEHGAHHFHPNVAHMKEWHGMHDATNWNKSSVTRLSTPKNFTIDPTTEHISIVNLELAHRSVNNHNSNAQGKGNRFPIYYDEHLIEWFQYVASRAHHIST